MTVELTGETLTCEELVRVARNREQARFGAGIPERIAASRAVLESALARDERMYGVNTGVGMRRDTAVEKRSIDAFNAGLVPDHRVAQGPLAAGEVVRAAMLCLANGFAKGFAGVSVSLAQRVVDALNDGVTPPVRTLGSVGQADLASMADLAWGLIGAEGGLHAKEGLALVNNNAFSTGWTALALSDCDRLLDTLDVAAALDLEAFAANLNLLHPLAGRSRPYVGLNHSLKRLRELLEASELWRPGAARNLQDPLTFRNLPAITGAARDAVRFAHQQLAVELNSSQENPIVCAEENRLISVGNLEILPLAAAVDFVRLSLAPALTSVCERAIKLLQFPWSGLPEGLAQRRGLTDDALAEFGVGIQAITAEARLLAAPVCYELVSSAQANGIEDRMTLAPLAARRLADMVELGERIVAIDMVVAAQAIDLRSPGTVGNGVAVAHKRIREFVPFVGEGDRTPHDLEPLRAAIQSGDLRGAPVNGSDQSIELNPTPQGAR